ncbi:hypothetical protein F441_01464 [Phytophthora nicotianae CJ01A1]|uniref:Uncharacterized protein n=1 Tax=Phytophthora nicotianae CJ01A1 TaxID=1317063 RepID=W2XT73_PHYNI|nr:hypothetical protein F441_01464 [Phytophthora nicotianae CJ01A1]
MQPAHDTRPSYCARSSITKSLHEHQQCKSLREDEQRQVAGEGGEVANRYIRS